MILVSGDDAAGGAGEHEFLIGWNDAHAHAPGGRRNYGGAAGIALPVNFNPEKFQAGADSFAEGGGVFANAAGEDEGVQATEGGGVGADPFFRLVAKQGQGLGGVDIGGFGGEQIADIRTGTGYAEKTGVVVYHAVKLRGSHLAGTGEIGNQARIQIAGAGAHDEAGGRSEAHAGVPASTITDGGKAGAIAEMGENDPATGGGGIAETHEFFHQISIGKAMKSIAMDTLTVEAPWNGQEFGHARHRLMKGGVETGDLGNFRVAPVKRLHQGDFVRQVVGVIGGEAAEFGEQRGRDAYGGGMVQSMHDAVTDDANGGETDFGFKPTQQEFYDGRMGGRRDGERGRRFLRRIGKGQIGSAEADAINFSVECFYERPAQWVNRKLDARRATIDCQNKWHGRFHEWADYRCHRILASSRGMAMPSKRGIARAV